MPSVLARPAAFDFFPRDQRNRCGEDLRACGDAEPCADRRQPSHRNPQTSPHVIAATTEGDSGTLDARPPSWFYQTRGAAQAHKSTAHLALFRRHRRRGGRQQVAPKFLNTVPMRNFKFSISNPIHTSSVSSRRRCNKSRKPSPTSCRPRRSPGRPSGWALASTCFLKTTGRKDQRPAQTFARRRLAAHRGDLSRWRHRAGARVHRHHPL